MGARASSLYQRIKATESSEVGADTSHGNATFPLKTAVYNMDAKVKREKTISN